MNPYIHAIPTKVYFGPGQIQQLAPALAAYGKRVLLVYGGGSIKKTGLYDTVIDLLRADGFSVVELSGVEPNPRIESVQQGVKLCKDHTLDVILAVGGGSVIDCAKAIATGVYYAGDDLWEMIQDGKGIRKALPLVDVLTISATGSEFDPTAVISNMKTHQKLGAKLTYPAVSICDPTYTYTVSKYQTAAGSADIMSHVMEGYFSRTDDSDLSDGIAEAILKSVIKYAGIALREPDNYTARANLMADSSVACSGIPEYGKQPTGWPCHAMEHQLSAYYDITHGVGLAILTPRWMRYILEKDPTVTPRFVRFARNVWGLQGEDDAALARRGIDALENFFVGLGLPMTLAQVGIGTEHFSDMAAKANHGNRMTNSYVPLNQEDVEAIFRACL